VLKVIPRPTARRALFTFAFRRAESESRASNHGRTATLLTHKNNETSIKHKMLRIQPRLAFINGVLLANLVLILRFQLLAVYVLLVHNCGASILRY
jgi:hypothetical protein